MNLKITEFFDVDTHSFTYVVHDEKTLDAIVIDPVSGGIYKEFLSVKGLVLKGILDTHIHADHMTEVQPGVPYGVGNLFFKDFEVKHFGNISVKAIPTPGHTPYCMSYLIEDNLFTGDALFMPDYGTGRCDFPGGSAENLFHSITKNLYSLPDETKVFVGHDYCPNGRELAFQTTIGESKKSNKHVTELTAENNFVNFRRERDKTLQPPKDIERNIRFNITAGKPLL